MNLRDSNVFKLLCVFYVFAALHSEGNVLVLSQDESVPIDSGDVIMREDAEETFYNVDIEKYQALGIKCPEPEPPENGVIVGRGTRVGSVVYVQCKEGYRLEGPTVMACVPTPKSAQWDPKVRRACVEGDTYFNEETERNDGNVAENSAQGTPLKHSENRPMEHSSPTFIGPKAHSTWTGHHRKSELFPEEEEMTGHEEDEDYEQVPQQCLHTPEPGPCRAYFKRFFFNKATFECQSFIYGGCHGNQNNFESIEDCNLTCLRHD